MRAHPNWWVFSLAAGGIVLGSVAQELYDWRLSFFLVAFLAIGYALGHLFWCGRTPRINPFGLGLRRRWWATALGATAIGADYWAEWLWRWEVVFFLVPLMLIGLILGHIFWCQRPVGLGRIYGPRAPGEEDLR